MGYFRDRLEQGKVTFNGKVINLPKSITDYGINLKLDK